ncbi:ABC transporter permease [Methanoculleus sp. MH98A]|uniref:ABC transporter permease n=1 Tax=Methanoculleus sp. MH98A TaxID=1495314 RepID=UPI000AB15835|nr:ABC transporter permease [Methanoculleus sp. MH98A]
MNPAAYGEQVRRAWVIARKDIRVYYLKGPVLIFGIFMPVFLFLAFFLGGRQLPLAFLVSGLVGMTLFFTSTAVSPAIFPWEGQARTLERLAACPVTVEAIVLGDMIASTLFGIGVTAITLLIGLALGLPLLHGIVLGFGILIAACCFSGLGMLLAVPPTNLPSNIMMLSTLLKFPLVFISGIFVPLEQMRRGGSCWRPARRSPTSRTSSATRFPAHTISRWRSISRCLPGSPWFSPPLRCACTGGACRGGCDRCSDRKMSGRCQ